LQVANFVLASILGRDGGVRDHRSRVRLAIFFAKTRMGWTAAKGHERVSEPIDAGDALQSFKDEIAWLARGLKAEETGGSSVAERDRSSICIRGQDIGASPNVLSRQCR
jgi:hypothetical protein